MFRQNVVIYLFNSDTTFPYQREVYLEMNSCACDLLKVTLMDLNFIRIMES